MRYVLPLILSACVVADASPPRPVGLSYGEAVSDCGEDGNAYLPSVPGAMVQALACHETGCGAAVWGVVGSDWVAGCGRDATVIEWTWIVPVR